MKKVVFILALFLLTTWHGAFAQDSFAVGDKVIVQGQSLTLYTAPGTGTIISDFPTGTVMEIVAGPEIVEGTSWWYVDNNYGWVPAVVDGQPVLAALTPEALETTIVELTAALAADPNNADAYYHRGWAYFGQQRYDEAITDLTMAIALDQDNPRFYRERGKVFLDSGDYPAAIQDLSVALTDLPNDIAAFNRRGVAYDQLYAYQQASMDYSMGMQIAPDYGLLYYNMGNIAYSNSNFYLALQYYDQAQTIDPHLYQVHIQRGYTYHDLGNETAALAEFEQALEYYPDEYRPYVGLGIIQESMGNFDTALDYYDQALSYETGNPFIYRSRGRLYYKMNRFGDAEDDFARAVEVAADPAEEHNMLGGMYSDLLGDFEAAIEHFDAAVDLGYTNAHWAVYNRGLAYRYLHEYDAALADFDAALEIQLFPAPILEKGGLFIALGRYDEALETYTTAIDLFPTLAIAYFRRGQLYETRFNDTTNALADFQRAAELNPYEPGFHQAVGDLYLDMGLYDEALAAYEQYISVTGEANADQMVLSRLEGLRAQQEQLQASHMEPVSSAPIRDDYDTAGYILYLNTPADQPGGDSALSLVTTDGYEVPLTDPGSYVDATWSPDGNRIAYSDPNGLYLMTPDTTNVWQLVSVSGPRDLMFSPDGSQIAYTANEHIWVVNADGSDNKNVTALLGDLNARSSRGIDWSPDSQHILAIGGGDTITFGIYQIDRDGTGYTLVVPMPDLKGTIYYPRYSPDGRQVAIHFEEEGVFSIRVTDLDSQEPILLETPGRVGGFAWSPDGRYMAYSGGDALFVAEMPSGAAPVQIAGDVLDSQYILGWTPDSQKVIFQACVNGQFCEYFTIEPDGANLIRLTDDKGLKRFFGISPAVK